MKTLTTKEQEYAAVRKRFKGIFAREATGTFTLRVCPACGKDKTGKKFIGGICDGCFRDGRDFPNEEERTRCHSSGEERRSLS